MKYIRHDIKDIPMHTIPDMHALKILNILFAAEVQKAHEATQRRVKFFRDLKELAEDGFIAIITSGMDCDGSEYNNNWTIVGATKQEVEGQVALIQAWADGTIYSIQLERPSVAKGIVSTSRDRTLEAFEDGHPWSI